MIWKPHYRYINIEGLARHTLYFKFAQKSWIQVKNHWSISSIVHWYVTPNATRNRRI